MKTNRWMRMLLAATALAASVGAADEKSVNEADRAIQRVIGTAPAEDFKFDTSKLGETPKAELPKARLTRKAFEQASIAAAIGGDTAEAEKPKKLGESRIMMRSKEWLIERDPKQGSFLVARRPSAPKRIELQEGAPSGEQKPAEPKTRLLSEIKLDEAKVKSLTMDRLGRFGIPGAEQGQILTREVVTQDLDGDSKQPSPIELFAYKTFVFRAVNGIPVQGHRAVITHTPGGEFKRALVRWPAIASNGNKLTTKLSIPQITERAALALRQERIAKGSQARLRWKYVPELKENGEVTLKLVAAARVAPPEKLAPGAFAEPREIEVAVDAE